MTITTVTTSTNTSYTVTKGNELLVAAGGVVTTATISSGGSLVVSGGAETSATIVFGGTETVMGGTAGGDLIYGNVVVTSSTAGASTLTNETVFAGGVLSLAKGGTVAGTTLSGGKLYISGGATASNTTLAGGGTIELATASATQAGSIAFANGGNKLLLDKVVAATAGDQGVISGFSSTDQIVVIETGATLSVTNIGGYEVATVTSSGVTDSFAFGGANNGAQYNSATLSWTSAGGSATLTFASSAVTSVATSTPVGAYTESGGATLLVTAGGSVTGATMNSGGFLYINGGVDSAAIITSGGWETVASGSATGDQIYGALVTLSGGAGVLTSEFVESGGMFALANGDLANGTTVVGGGTMIVSGADAGANNIVLISGGVLNLASPKATISGTLTFIGGSNTLEATAAATAGYGELAVISGFTTTDVVDIAFINSAGAALTVTSNGGNEVATVVGGGASESFVFSGTATYNNLTLQLGADSGGHAEIIYNPNGAGVTVSAGTNASGLTVIPGETLIVQAGAMVSATNVQSAGSLVVSGGDTGAIVSAGATESVFGSASGDQIAGGITVTGAATGETVSSGGGLTVIGGANASATIDLGGTEIVTNSGSTSGDQIYGLVTVNVGSMTGDTVENGGSVIVSAGVDSGSTILSGGAETISGSAVGDQVYGTQLVSFGGAVVTGETVYAGGAIDLFLKGAVASGTIVSNGGELNISGNAAAINTVLSGGGVLIAESPKVVLSGTLTFAGGGNTYDIAATTSVTFGDLAVNVGFSQTDKIDLAPTAFNGSALTLSQAVVGGQTVVDVISGGSVVVEAFTFSDPTLVNSFTLLPDGAGGEELVLVPISQTTSVTTSTVSGGFIEDPTDTLLVLNGGSVSAAIIQSGGFLVVAGGVDQGAFVSSGGTETIFTGAASGDQIYGSAIVSGGSVNSETLFSGAGITLSAGASVANLVLDGGAVADLASTTASLTGTVTFAGGANLLETAAIPSTGYGDKAVISGFSSSDKIDVAGVALSGSTLSFSTNDAGQSVATISGGGNSESFIFSDPSTYNSASMSLIADGAGGVDLILDTTPVVAITSLAGQTMDQTNSPTTILNGTVNTSVDPEAIGATVSVLEGGTVVGAATVGANGQWAANVTFANDSGSNVLTATVTDAAGNTGVTSQSVTYDVNTAAAAFTSGDLVVSISGDGDGSGTYGDNAASPVTLEQITTAGTFVSQIVLPQVTTVVNGVTEYAISSEYGSQSEGSLQLSGDGQSLVIAGYGVNDTVYNTAPFSSYGGNALAQSTSVPGGLFTVVPRVVADINADGVVDTSTALTGVFNLNNPRSVATIDGKSFWLSGQGVKGDTTQGVFYATDGATTATSINAATDTRTAEIYNGVLYVSADSTQGATNISSYGLLPTGQTAPTVLYNISNTVTLTAATANTVNTSAIGTAVNLSPENFFFANADTLYVADSGNPKNGGIGDGGLQKWVFNGSAWTLQYTLSQGLNLVADVTSTGGAVTYGTSGLIGLTGKVVGGTVQLYATSYNLTDIEPTYVYAITDTLNSNTGAGESFATIFTAAPGSNVRGIAFAPTAPGPTIAGTDAAVQDTTADAPIAPFSTVTVADPNANATDTLTITVGGAGGTLSGAGLTGGAAGVYTLAGTSASITAELDALSFTAPNGAPGTTSTSTFTLSDLSTANTAPTVDSSTSVQNTEPASIGNGFSIDLPGAGVETTIAYTSATDALTLTGGSQAITLDLVGPPGGEEFAVGPDGSGGTLLTVVTDPAGTYSAPGDGVATIDLPGTYSLAGASAPTPAPAGSYVPTAGATFATLDPAGYYTASAGSSALTAADPGHFVATAGATSETVDPLGYYTSGYGSSAAVAADPGYYVGAIGATREAIDPAGTFTASPGASAPTPAPAGSYVPTAGATFAILDPVGYYTASAGSSALTAADPGYFVATAGATSETVDPLGYYTSGYASSAPVAADPGYYVATAGATSQTLDPTGTYSGPAASAYIVDPAITSVVGTPLNGGTVELKGSGLAGATVKLFADGDAVAVESGTVNGAGGFDVTTSGPYADGVHTFTVTQTAAGLTSPVSQVFDVSVLPTAPTIVSQVGTPTDGQTVEVQGTAESGTTVNLYDNGGSTLVGSTTAANGTFDIVTTTTFAAGTYGLTAMDSDTAGLSSAASPTFDVAVNPALTAWKAAVTGDWALATAWTGGKAPNTVGTMVTIATSGRYAVSVAAGESFTVGSVTFNDPTAFLSVSGALSTVGGLTDTAGAITLSGAASLSGPVSLAKKGTLTGYGTVGGPVENLGVISAQGGALDIAGSVAGVGGVIKVAGGASVELGGGYAGQTVAMTPSGGSTLILDSLAGPAGAITGFGSTDVLDLKTVAATAESFSGGVLTLYGVSGILGTVQVATASPFTKKIFALTPYGADGVSISLAADIAPTLSAPMTTLADKVGLSAAVSGVSLAYADSAVSLETFTVTVTDKTGTLSAIGSPATVMGQNSTSLTIQGSLSAVNAALGDLAYKGAAIGGDTIKIAANNGLGETTKISTVKVVVSAAPMAAVFAQSMAAMTEVSPGAMSLATQASAGSSLANLFAPGR